MKILVVNCGSSSVKFQPMAGEPEARSSGALLARGVVSDAGGAAVAECSLPDTTRVRGSAPFFDHGGAVEQALQLLARPEVGALADRSEEEWLIAADTQSIVAAEGGR